MTGTSTDDRGTPSSGNSDVRRLQPGDYEFMGPDGMALVTDTGRSSHLILAATLLLFLAGLTWAAFARIDEVTHGTGKVIPSGKVQIIQNLEGGILAEVLVSEGSIVEQGQPLLRLDDVRFSASYGESRAKYLAQLARAARLQSEASGETFVMPDEVSGEQPELAAGEMALYNSRAGELQSRRGTLLQQRVQTRQELAEMIATRDKLARSLELVRQELSMSEPLAVDGAISEVEILRLKRNVNETRGDLEASQLAIPRLQAALREVESRIEDLEIGFRTEAQSELLETRSEISALESTLRSDQDRVSRTLVKSPVRGTVKQIKITTIGGVIQPGMDLMEIVPLDGSLLVEAHVRPADIAFLRPEQNAMVKLTAYDYAVYGGLPAKLEHISADSITNENGDSFFLIRVRTDRSYLGARDKPLKIIPGMTAMVDILTGQKTVLDYLLKPVMRAREMALRER